MLFFQDPSLLQFQERLLKQKQRCNLQTIFGVRGVPKESQMRERLGGVSAVREWMTTRRWLLQPDQRESLVS